MLTSLPDPDDLVRAALLTLESGAVCTDLATIEAGTERGIAFHRVGPNAVVSVVARPSTAASFHQANVLLVADDGGQWEAPHGTIHGTSCGSEVLHRVRGGPAGNVSVGGRGQGPPVGHGEPIPPRPSVMWAWVSGIAPDDVVAVGAASTIATATNVVVAETGAFVVLLEAPWGEHVSYWGTTEDGAVVALEAPVDRGPGHGPTVDGDDR